MWQYLVIYALCINLISWIMMGIDKSKAKKVARRIPEKMLFTLAAVGGSVGIYIGMRMFRHKTRHRSFQIVIPVFILLHAVVLYVFTLNQT